MNMVAGKSRACYEGQRGLICLNPGGDCCCCIELLIPFLISCLALSCRLNTEKFLKEFEPAKFGLWQTGTGCGEDKDRQRELQAPPLTS